MDKKFDLTIFISILILLLSANFKLSAKTALGDKQWIIFYAEDWGSLDSPTGHAFVSFVEENDKLQQTVYQCWGFYPKNGIGLFGHVESKLKNDIARQKDFGFAVEVTNTDFQNCLAIKNAWEAKKYNLLAKNCIDFIHEVALQICNLKRPSFTMRFPIDYVKSLKSLNSNYKKCNSNYTLFLFDLSGSMMETGPNASIPKLDQAKNASKQTLKALKNNNSGTEDEVAVLGFSGDCVADPTILISDFETDLQVVENRINTMMAGGGTPLAEAVRAAQCKLANHLAQTGQDRGKLILLSDGQATCQAIRPVGTYNSAPLGQKDIFVSADQCGTGKQQIKYYTIGFNISPGSPAERDLQYLSQISGGKYLNVQSQTQLERAFRKFNRTYVPKPNPSLNGLPAPSLGKFDEGVNQITGESFPSALKTCGEFAALHPDDCHGAYNLALMQEANDFYKQAIANYKKYLSLCPNASDRDFVERQIAFLEEEFKQFVLFQKEVIKSDLEYLKLHFERIQNGQSVALAEEFKGFLKEKGNYYKDLPEQIGRADRVFQKNCQEVATGLANCAAAIKRNPQTWDRDATPTLSLTFINLERLLDSF